MKKKTLSLFLMSTMVFCLAFGFGKKENDKIGNPASEISAYADFLSDYMKHPVISAKIADEWDEDDKPENSQDVFFTLIYVDDDDIPELALSNGSCPWNPVHLFTYADGSVKEMGEYSMYGKMYYSPKKGYILPMYYFPPGNAEINIYGSEKTIYYDIDRIVNSFLPVADYNCSSLSSVRDITGELERMKKVAPTGITPLGAPIVDDSYLTEGEVLFKGKHADQIPGIWYLSTDDDYDITWIEFDNNGTFTAHGNVEGDVISGYISYEQESPLLEDGGIYYLFYPDGTRYDGFEIGPVEDYGYMMNFFGRVYYKHPFFDAK
ncbi:hypothetical protein [Butyrivibrio sp. AE3004]|uniref:hypothetical protein n=1 Tax=Butyrivibrio sp. AE3004 TaxID=1506994 RepID=UPI000493BEF3|nr:hypothetical protein [Butyrivibrio sp. AE3004]